MPPLFRSPSFELTSQFDTLTQIRQNHSMCPIKNLLTKRSTRDLRNPNSLSPFPPDLFPPTYQSEGEIGRGLQRDLKPKRESKRESNRGFKSKRQSVRVQPPLPISLLPIHPIDLCSPSAPTLLPHLPRSLHSPRTLRRSTQGILDLAIAVEGAGADLVVSVERWCEA